MGYRVQTVEVDSEHLGEIIEVFVRINSTGMRLTGAEKLHAQYYESQFLRVADQFARRHKHFYLENRILSPGALSRMKHIELTAELLASVYRKGPIHSKDALNTFIRGESIDLRSVNRCLREMTRTFHLVKKVFPELRSTRFANAVDFYTLFLVLWELDCAGCVLTEHQRNGQAEKLLGWLSDGVDQVRQQQKRTEGTRPDQSLFAEYLLTVQGQTDHIGTRRRRAEVLKKLLGGLFEKKDSQRLFTPAQRRLIWNSETQKVCAKCSEPLDWTNFTIDHIKPHALGGKTVAENARIVCRPCNSRLGARRGGR